MYNKCDKHQRSQCSRFINPQLRNTTERIYSPLGPTLVSLSLSQTTPSIAQITWPSANIPGTPTSQQVSHNIHGLSCPDSHIKFMTSIDLLRLQVSSGLLHNSLHAYSSPVHYTPTDDQNIIIIKVRSDPGIASPGRFAWAWGGLLLRHCRKTLPLLLDAKEAAEVPHHH